MNQRETVAATLACDLAEEIVRSFGELRLRVFGTSMVPSILPGDLVSILRVGISEVSIGEIVLYSRARRLFVHRVVCCTNGPEQPLLITRGDHLDHDDAPVSSAELLGRVTSIQRPDRRGYRQIEFSSLPLEPNHLMLRALRTSDRATYFYLRLSALWRSLVHRGEKCQA
jgi:signal peptidase I